MTTRRRILGPFNRVEGDLEVSLDIADGRVAAAYVNSPLYRGFEQILQGKAPQDALTLVPRICGICSVAQSAASALALADAAGIEPPENGRLAANLTLAVENLADHLTHFYLFFMPDVCHADYAGRPWYARAGRPRHQSPRHEATTRRPRPAYEPRASTADLATAARSWSRSSRGGPKSSVIFVVSPV